MTETAVMSIAGVYGPNDHGFFDIKSDDGKKFTTKKPALAEAARAYIGTSGLVEFKTVVRENNGVTYTNFYFEAIRPANGQTQPELVGATPVAAPVNVEARITPTTTPDHVRQQLIVRQSSWNRATELAKFIVPATATNDPEALFTQLKELAHWIELDVRRGFIPESEIPFS